MWDGKKGQLMYILEAMLEHFVALLVAGSYLATVTKELGFSDGLTGILSSIISLGCLFQLIAVSIRKSRVKKLVIGLSVANQLLFTFLYVIPLFDLSQTAKTVIFVVSIIGAYFLYNVAHPHKINWLMGLVDKNRRGDFTANKEIISLIGGIVFSFGCGRMIDYFKEQGKLHLAFALTAGVILVLMLLHTLTMLLAAEKETAPRKQVNLGTTLKNIVTDKTIFKITLVFVLFNVAKDVSLPFIGAYCVGDLGFSLTAVTIFGIFGSVARILVSKFWGRYADRKSFARMLEKCFLILSVAFLALAFTAPGKARIMYLFYAIIHGISMGGINSAQINLVYDYVEEERRADCLAVTQALAGLAGFLTTLAISPLLTFLQNHDRIFGIQLYGQQILSFGSFIVTCIAVIYVRKVVLRIQK